MNTTPRKFYDGMAGMPAPGQIDKKLTPMAAHIEWLKKERKTLYEFGYDVAADRISAAIDNATPLLEAEREYASQQAPEGMYTREQMEGAWNAGYERCNFELYPERFNKQPKTRVQFIQSLK